MVSVDLAVIYWRWFCYLGNTISATGGVEEGLCLRLEVDVENPGNTGKRDYSGIEQFS